MTAAEVPLEPGHLVQIEGTVGFFRVVSVPEHGEFVHLYGGRVQRRGGVRAVNRSVSPAKVERITNVSTLMRAHNALRAIDEAMAQAPKPHWKKAGAK